MGVNIFGHSIGKSDRWIKKLIKIHGWKSAIKFILQWVLIFSD